MWQEPSIKLLRMLREPWGVARLPSLGTAITLMRFRLLHIRRCGGNKAGKWCCMTSSQPSDRNLNQQTAKGCKWLRVIIAFLDCQLEERPSPTKDPSGSSRAKVPIPILCRHCFLNAIRKFNLSPGNPSVHRGEPPGLLPNQAPNHKVWPAQCSNPLWGPPSHHTI